MLYESIIHNPFSVGFVDYIKKITNLTCTYNQNWNCIMLIIRFMEIKGFVLHLHACAHVRQRKKIEVSPVKHQFDN